MRDGMYQPVSGQHDLQPSPPLRVQPKPGGIGTTATQGYRPAALSHHFADFPVLADMETETNKVHGLPATSSAPIQMAKRKASETAGTDTRGKTNRALGIVKPSLAKPSKAKRRLRNFLGSHGFRRSEQQRLRRVYGRTVSGSTHESEHTIGFEPLNQTSGERRGRGPRARRLENRAPAYQEYRPFHRDHIGTGSRGQVDPSGFNARTYRDAQRASLVSGNVSSAVQLNQLGYAFNPAFQSPSPSPEVAMATDSFNTMARNMQSFTYAQGASDVDVPVTETGRQEMLLARQAALTGRWPTLEEIARANNAIVES